MRSVRGNGGKQVMGTIGIGRLGNILHWSTTQQLQDYNYTGTRFLILLCYIQRIIFSDDGFLIIEGMDMRLGFFG